MHQARGEAPTPHEQWEEFGELSCRQPRVGLRNNDSSNMIVFLSFDIKHHYIHILNWRKNGLSNFPTITDQLRLTWRLTFQSRNTPLFTLAEETLRQLAQLIRGSLWRKKILRDNTASKVTARATFQRAGESSGECAVVLGHWLRKGPDCRLSSVTVQRHCLFSWASLWGQKLQWKELKAKDSGV